MRMYKLSITFALIGILIALLMGCDRTESPASPSKVVYTGSSEKGIGPPIIPMPIFTTYLPNTAMIQVWEADYIGGKMVMELDYLQAHEEQESGDMIMKVTPDFCSVELCNTAGVPFYSYTITEDGGVNTTTIWYQDGDYSYTYIAESDGSYHQEASAGATSDYIEFASYEEMELAYSLYLDIIVEGNGNQSSLPPYEAQLLIDLVAWVDYLDSIGEPDFTVAIETGLLLLEDETYLAFLDNNFGDQIEPFRGMFCDFYRGIDDICRAVIRAGEIGQLDLDDIYTCTAAGIGTILCSLWP